MPRKPFTLIPEKMEAVTRAALQEFSRVGYSHSSTNRICQQAGVSKGALFHNFHSKENLFFALIQDGVRLAEGVFRNHLALVSQDMSFEELFVRSFMVLLEFVKAYPDHYIIYLRLIYDPDIPERDRMKGRDIVRTFTSTISDTLYREGKRREIFREDLDEKIMGFLFNTLITRFVELYFFPLRDPGLNIRRKSMGQLKTMILSLYELLVNGLGKSSST